MIGKILTGFVIPGEVVAILIIIASVALFTVTFLLNRKLKAPEGAELPEKCHSCSNTLCKEKIEEKVDLLNKSKTEMTPDELIEYLKREEQNNVKK